MGAHAVKSKACALCGATMTGVDTRRKYCPDCLSTVRKINAEEYRKKLKAEYEEKKKQALPQGSSIRDVCTRAEAAGRTYGQQVEFERRQKELRDRGEID